MTKGTIVLVTPDNEVWKTLEFNGDMYIDEGHGEEVLRELRGISSLNELKNLIYSLNNKYYHYSLDDEPILYSSSLEKLCTMKNNYMDNWFSDYLYIKNASNSTINIKCKDGTIVTLAPNNIIPLYFGTIVCSKLDFVNDLTKKALNYKKPSNY